MLLCLGSFVALLSLFDTVLASGKSSPSGRKTNPPSSRPVCRFNFTKRIEINAMSDIYTGFESCEYILHAPTESNIVLNFTKIFGFKAKLDKNGTVRDPLPTTTTATAANIAADDNCLPELRITDLVNGSQTAILQTLCRGKVNFQAPHVFHTNSSLIKVVYQWSPDRVSGFTLDFDFHEKKNICKISCDGPRCPPGSVLVCNDRGAAGCQEDSGKANCNNTSVSPPAQQPSTDYIPIIVIIVPVVFILGTCVVSYYRVASRVWRDHRTRETNSVEHSQLHPQAQVPTSEVVYVPGSTPDRLQRQLAAAREKQCRTQRARADAEVDLPPHIAISEDGEEGFAQYQRLLQRPLNPVEREAVRPPPNRCVYDGESPPSYHSNSAILLDQDNSTGSSWLSVTDCNGWSAMIPCRRAAPSNNNSHVSNIGNAAARGSNSHSPPQSSSHHGRHTRHSRHASGSGGGSTVSHSLDRPPPDYDDVMNHDRRTEHTDSDEGSTLQSVLSSSGDPQHSDSRL